jgi:hypothetical protein
MFLLASLVAASSGDHAVIYQAPAIDSIRTTIIADEINRFFGSAAR